MRERDLLSKHRLSKTLREVKRRLAKGRRQRAVGKRSYLNAPPSESVRSAMQLSLRQGTYVVFDIETTGGNPERNGITEICALRYQQGAITDSFYSLVDPEIPIPPIVRRMTGINNKMVKGEPTIDVIMPKFVSFIADDFLVSHNTIGDMKFLRHFAKTTGNHSLENFYLCTHLLVEKLLPEAPDKSLTGLSSHLGLTTGDLHRAEADAYATLKLFEVLLDKLEEKDVNRIEAAIKLQGDIESGMRLGSVLKTREELTEITDPGIYRLTDQQGELLFQSSTSNLARDLRKLGSYTQVPKRLLRILLGADDIEFEPCLELLEAYLRECDLEQQQSSKYDPLEWHQREVGHITLTPQGSGTYSLSLGRIGRDTIKAFGPIRDRRFGRQLLDTIVQALMVEMTESDYLVDEMNAQVIEAAFTGSLDKLDRDIAIRSRSLRLLFSPKKRAVLTETSALIKRMQAANLPSLKDHLGRTGFIEICVDSAKGGEVPAQKHIYPVINGYPYLSFLIENSFEDWLNYTENRSKVTKFLEQAESHQPSLPSSLPTNDGDKARNDQNESEKDDFKNPRRAVALAWYLSSRRRGARFISPRILVKETK